MRIIITFFIFPILIFSQETISNYNANQNAINALKNTFKSYNKNILFKDKLQKKLLKYHKDQQKIILANSRIENYLYDSNYNGLIDELIAEIIKENNLEFKGIAIKSIINNSFVPNASNIGYNLIMVNKGLFIHLNTYMQLKAILTHELSHLKLNHYEKVLEYKLNYSIPENFNLKRLNQNNIKKNNLLKNYKYDYANFKRQQEYQADSLTLKLLNQTKNRTYLFNESLKLITDNFSIPPSKLTKETLKNILNIYSINFNDKWFVSNYTPNDKVVEPKFKFNRDSLKTHPNLLERINYLKGIYVKDFLNKKETNEGDNKEKQSLFLQLKKDAIEEASIQLNSKKVYFKSFYFNLLYFHFFKNSHNAINKVIKDNLFFFSKLKNQNRLLEYFEDLAVNKNNKDYVLIMNLLLNISEKELEDWIEAIK